MNPFDCHKGAWITAFWSWRPLWWGCVGWTFPGARRRVVDLMPDPFLCVIYTTKSVPLPEERPNAGRVMGMYELTHEIGHRDAHSPPDAHPFFPERWQHALRATRAWEFPDRPLVEWLEPEIYEVPGLARTTGIHGKPLSRAGWRRLRSLAVEEVDLFRGEGDGTP